MKLPPRSSLPAVLLGLTCSGCCCVTRTHGLIGPGTSPPAPPPRARSGSAPLPPPPPPPPSASVLDKVRMAMSLTARSAAGNVTAAREASKLWEAILPPPTAVSSDGAVRIGEEKQTDATVTPTPLPDIILAASLALYAATLAQTGKDNRAVVAYGNALELRQFLTPASLHDVQMGRGSALQRLLRYGEGKDQFLECLDGGSYDDGGGGGGSPAFVARAAYGAATCALRLGDVDGAVDAISRYGRRVGGDNHDDDVAQWDGDIAGMLGFVLWTEELLRGKDNRDGDAGIDDGNRAFKLLSHAAGTSSSPLYSWLYHVATKSFRKDDCQSSVPLTAEISSPKAATTSSNEGGGEESIFLDLAAINQSPFDDASLLRMDDKVFLHQLMTSHDDDTPSSSSAAAATATRKFWPDGFVLPDEIDGVKRCISSSCRDNSGSGAEEATEGVRWMLKERAGYGSYGNRVVPSAEEVLAYAKGLDDGKQQRRHHPVDPILCQRIIDPPLLIDGRKFSMRVYVVYFGSDESQIKVYLSTEGLAKLASAAYRDGLDGGDEEAVDDAYMTNSGRGEGGDAMDQLDFHLLRAEFERRGWQYDEMWSDVTTAVRVTMERYRDNLCSLNRLPPSRLLQAQSRLPKILGFDFLLDSARRPWLIEVNRFPGLEPRGRCDEGVKRKVVEDAWYLSLQLAGLPCQVVGLAEEEYRMSSLRSIHLS